MMTIHGNWWTQIMHRGTIMRTLSNKGGCGRSEEQTNTSSDDFVTELLLMKTPTMT